MPLSFREADASALPTLVALEREVFSDAWGAGALSSHLASETACSLLAAWEGEPVGYLLGILLPPEGEIYRIAVRPAWRGRGIARAILQRFLDICTERSVTSLYLEVRRSNVAAQALYRSAGFLPCGERRSYYRDPTEDALLFSRTAEGAEKGSEAPIC